MRKQTNEQKLEKSSGPWLPHPALLCYPFRAPRTPRELSYSRVPSGLCRYRIAERERETPREADCILVVWFSVESWKEDEEAPSDDVNAR